MTPGEWEYTYRQFMKDDDVYYISEHRKSYDNTEEFKDTIHKFADITLFPFSITRFAAEEAKKMLEADGIKVNVIHQLWIKPFICKNQWIKALNNSAFGGIVLDDDYEEGAASSIAHNIMINSDKKVRTLCLEHRTAGFYPTVDNLPPSAEKIYKKVKEICNV